MPVPSKRTKKPGQGSSSTSSPAVYDLVDAIADALGPQPEGVYATISDRIGALDGLDRAGGKTWLVIPAVGSDSGNGSLSAPLGTITAATAYASAGDTIGLLGTTFSEAVTCTKAGLRYVGIGTGPAQTVWTAPTVAGSFCLKLSAASCLLDNIKIKPVVYTTSGVPSGILLDTTASYTKMRGVRFQGQTGSYVAVYSPAAGADNVQVLGCEFLYMNTAAHGQAILGVDAGGLNYSGWHIEGCFFNSNLTHIDISGRSCCIRGNTFNVGGIGTDGAVNASLTTKCIDLSGTNSGANQVGPGNSFDGAYTSSLYTGGAAGDNWAGNFAAITATYCPNGITVPTKPA